jgi:hypothetical protein
VKFNDIIEMKNIFKVLLATTFALCTTIGGAQMKTSYFMENSVPRYQLNAALTPNHGYVNFPFLPIAALGMDVNNNFATLDNFIYPNGQGGHVTFMHPSVDASQFLNSLPAHPSLRAEVNYNLLGFAKYHNRRDYFWSFGLNLRTTADATIPKEIFSILKDFRDGSYNVSDIAISGSSFLEFAFGYAGPVGWQNIVIGGRLKFLVGLAQLDASLNNIKLDVDKDKLGVSANGTMQLHHALMNFDNRPTNENGGINMANLLDYKNSFGFKNGISGLGVAIDLGIDAKFFSERLKVSAAVNDLGFIKWGKANNFIADMDDIVYEFRGINFDTGDSEVIKPEDISFRRLSSQDYSRKLTSTMNFGVEYNFFKNLLGVGVVSHIRKTSMADYSEFMVVGTVRPSKWFTAAVSHSIVQNKFGLFGLALNFHPRGLNFFLGFDYIPTKMGTIDNVPVPMNLKSFNTYIGFAFSPNGRAKPWK